MNQRRNDPWVHGDPADPLIALVVLLVLGALAASVLMLLR
jgi:hypothetical protein